MIGALEIPEFCKIPQEQRRLAWVGRQLPPSSGMMVIGRTVVRDAGTERVRVEVEQAQAARRARGLAAKRDAEAIRKRGIKNERLVKLAAAGKIALPQPPIKIVRVVDLNQLGRKPATEETDVKKTAKKTTAKARVRRGAKKVLKARKAAKVKPTPKRARANSRTPVLAEGGRKINAVVQTIADMMTRKVGHPDAPLGGASMAEMTKATGVEPHPMRAKIKQVRDVLGYTTTAPSKANEHRYHAEPPKKKAEG